MGSGKLSMYCIVYCVRKKGKYGVNSICDSKSGADSENDEYAFTVDSGNIGGMLTVQLGGVSVEVLTDSPQATGRR